MKKFQTSTILAAAGALLLAASAQAATGVYNEKPVRSIKFGNVVVDSQGDCVVTKWEGAKNECKGGLVLTKELRTVYFAFNSSALNGESKTKLNTLAKALKTNKVQSVSIVGYADEVGTDSYNQRLSEKRANAVAANLRAKGIKVVGKSEVRGLGETSSQSDCEGKAGKALHACLWRDRRVEVEVVQ